MAAGLSSDPHGRPPAAAAATGRPLLDSPRLRAGLLATSVALLLVVGLSRPNAAQPDLLPRGWAPGTILPLTLSATAVTVVLVAAYVTGAAGVWLGLRGRPAPLRSWRLPTAIGLLTLLAAPFGSADHVNYLAYGRILVQGGDPWTESPDAWAGGSDPVVSRVEAPWTEEPSVYGPFGTLLHAVSASVGGDVLRQGVWVWQLIVVVAWLAVRAVLRATLAETSRGRVDVLWTLNPLVLGVGVLGAHIDVVAAALAVGAVAAAARWSGQGGAVVAGVLAGLALTTKVTYGVVLVALLAATWWVSRSARPHGARPWPPWGRWVGLVLGTTLVVAPLHLWAGEHVFDQLERSRRAVSLATPWRLVLEALAPTLGGATTRTLIAYGAAVLALVLAVALLRVSRASEPPAGPDDPTDPGPGPAAVGPWALWLTACLALAYSLAAAYSLPWYDVLVWAALPALAPGVVDLVALARFTVIACAYVPGRVLGMTPTVEAVTLGFRRHVAPWLVLALWVVVVSLGVRRGSPRWPWRPRAGHRPPATR